MNGREITMKRRGRDNVGGQSIDFDELDERVPFFESIIELSSLPCTDPAQEHHSLKEVTEEFTLLWPDGDAHPVLAGPAPGAS
jgi:hypothetical protein